MNHSSASLRGSVARVLERKDASTRDPETEARELAAQLQRIQDGIATFADQARKANGDLSRETKEAIDKLLLEQTTISVRLGEVEQRMVRPPGPAESAHKSVGQIVIDNEEVQALMKAQDRRRVRVDVKAITTVGAPVLVRPDRTAPVLLPQMRLTVRDLIAPGRTAAGSIEYVRELAFTNAAAPVPENTAKPEADLTFDLQLTPVVTIAHWIRASRQILSDAPALQSQIDERLRYGLALREEAQLLKGSGITPNLKGIYTVATAYAAPIAITGATNIDTLRLAMLQTELALLPATGIVMNPADWAAIELSKDLQNRYLFANPQGTVTPTLWGLPVVSTPALAVTEFLVGSFRMGAQIFDRENATVEISTEDRDNFITNMVTILAEERLALAVYRPAAFVKGTFA